MIKDVGSNTLPGIALIPTIKIRKVEDAICRYDGISHRALEDLLTSFPCLVRDTAMAASDGAFETLTGTTAAVTDDCVLMFIVDSGGMAGCVNVDTLNIG